MAQDDENLIVIKKSSAKKLIAKISLKLYDHYLKAQKELTMFWRKVFRSESRIMTLLNSPAIVLFFNTVLFGFVGRVFEGLISQMLLYAATINIFMFLFEKMGWIEKMRKWVATE